MASQGLVKKGRPLPAEPGQGRLLRKAAIGDLSSKKDFKQFIQVRNDFHEALSQLNEALYATKNALMLPELLDLQEWLDS